MMDNATQLSCSEFGNKIVNSLMPQNNPFLKNSFGPNDVMVNKSDARGHGGLHLKLLSFRKCITKRNHKSSRVIRNSL